VSTAATVAIVIAWTDEGYRVAEERRTDLGERPRLEAHTVAKTALWLLEGTPDDVAKAKAYAGSPASIEGARVYTYPVTEADPRGRAARDVLAGKVGA
jgi:hypothetical protein